MCKEKDFNDHQSHAQNEERHHFPAGQPGEIMAEKEKREADCGNNSGHRCAWNFKFEISAKNSAEQKQWRERSDPKRELLESSWSQRNHVPFQPRLLL